MATQNLVVANYKYLSRYLSKLKILKLLLHATKNELYVLNILTTFSLCEVVGHSIFLHQVRLGFS